MSEPDQAQPPQTAEPRGCLTALMFLTGIILLLPGLCSLAVMVAMIAAVFQEGSRVLTDPNAPPIIGLWLVTFAIAAAGILLIRRAARPRR
ncbi:MAG: hypothetical protein P4M07_04440 [Xanthobacteraceae bacterium]|nr:hypothetical protein [Xanthobacteraceae bacterium]